LRKFRRNKRRRPTSLRDDSSTALRIEPNARVLATKTVLGPRWLLYKKQASRWNSRK
jgi:hypothetical protein